MPKARGPISSTKASNLEPENGRHTSRRARAYSDSTRNTLFRRVDGWIYDILPTTARSSLPTLSLLYCILSVWLFSGYITSGPGHLSRAPDAPATLQGNACLAHNTAFCSRFILLRCPPWSRFRWITCSPKCRHCALSYWIPMFWPLGRMIPHLLHACGLQKESLT